MSESRYLFDNSSGQAATRFSGLEAALDPTTFRHLSALGIAPGAVCLEVGAGGGSVARWMAARVGPSGRVVAADLDTRWVDTGGAANVEVRTLDLVSDALEPASFDVVHARLVLLHIPQRDEVLPRLAAALRPGGWLVVEEFGKALPYVPDATTPEQQTVDRVVEAVRTLLVAGGGDPVGYAQTLPRRFREAGLADVGAEGTVVFGTQAVADVHRANVAQTAERIVAAGLASADDVATAVRVLQSPDFFLALSLLVSVWGRRP